MFVLGLLGSGHCVGMCGPLVLAIPAPGGRLLPHFAYHAGRITTYGAVGAGLGALGSRLSQLPGGSGTAALERVHQIQAAVTFFAAVLLVAFGLMRLGALREPKWLREVSPGKIPGWSAAVRSAVRGRQLLHTLWLGLLMGLLPCGLSYAAFARALPAGSGPAGALLVVAFGVGTAPALIILGTAASGLARRTRRVSDLLSALLLIGMGTSLALKAVF